MDSVFQFVTSIFCIRKSFCFNLNFTHFFSTVLYFQIYFQQMHKSIANQENKAQSLNFTNAFN